MKLKLNNRGEIVTLVIITATIISGIVSLISLSLLKNNKAKRITTNIKAQEGWSCPGGNCDKCGQDGPWIRSDECGDFCDKHSTDPNCIEFNQKKNPTSTPEPTPEIAISPTPAPTVVIPTPNSAEKNIPSTACTQCAANGHCEWHPLPGCTDTGCTVEGKQCPADRETQENPTPTAPSATSNNSSSNSDFCARNPEVCLYRTRQSQSNAPSVNAVVQISPEISNAPADNSDYFARHPEVIPPVKLSNTNPTPQWSMPWDWLGDRIKEIQQPKTSSSPQRTDSVVNFSQDVTVSSNPELAYLNKSCSSGTGTECVCVSGDTCMAYGQSGGTGGESRVVQTLHVDTLARPVKKEESSNFLSEAWNLWSASPVNPDNIGNGLNKFVSNIQNPSTQSTIAQDAQKTIFAPFDWFGKWTGWNDPNTLKQIASTNKQSTAQKLGIQNTPWNQFKDNVTNTFNNITGFFSFPTETKAPEKKVETVPPPQPIIDPKNVVLNDNPNSVSQSISDVTAKKILNPDKYSTKIGLEGMEQLPDANKIAKSGMNTRTVILPDAFDANGKLKDPTQIAYTHGDAEPVKQLSSAGVNVNAVLQLTEGKNKEYIQNMLTDTIINLKPKSLIIGNEMNLPNEIPTSTRFTNMDEYYEQLKFAYQMAKQLDPNITIYPYGLAPGRYNLPDNQPPVDEKGRNYLAEQGYVALDEMLAYYDKHPYSSTQKYPFDGIDAHAYFPYQVEQLTDKYKNVLDKHNADKIPIYLGEVGLPTHDSPDAEWGVHFQTQESQSNVIWQNISLAYNKDVTGVNLFSSKDSPGSEDKWGLVDLNGKPRPAYDAYTFAQKIFNNTQDVKITKNNDISITTVMQQDGTRARIVWNEDHGDGPRKGIDKTLNNIPPTAKVYDKYGKEVKVQRDENNIGTLTLTKPDNAYVGGNVYIIVDKPGVTPVYPTAQVKVKLSN